MLSDLDPLDARSLQHLNIEGAQVFNFSRRPDTKISFHATADLNTTRFNARASFRSVSFVPIGHKGLSENF